MDWYHIWHGTGEPRQKISIVRQSEETGGQIAWWNVIGGGSSFQGKPRLIAAVKRWEQPTKIVSTTGKAGIIAFIWMEAEKIGWSAASNAKYIIITRRSNGLPYVRGRQWLKNNSTVISITKYWSLRLTWLRFKGSQPDSWRTKGKPLHLTSVSSRRN